MWPPQAGEGHPPVGSVGIFEAQAPASVCVLSPFATQWRGQPPGDQLRTWLWASLLD